MLFDLRGRRRRVVQAVYLMLAVLLGGGLVLFGIGGDVSGGLVDAFKGGGGSSVDSALQDKVNKEEERLAKNPQNAAVLQLLIRDYYSFVTLLMLAMGLGFQIPVGVLAACKLRITSPEQLRRGRRFAIVGIVVLASLLPTLDPLTLILESIPLYALYELSIVLASAWGSPIGDVGEEPAVEGSG